MLCFWVTYDTSVKDEIFNMSRAWDKEKNSEFQTGSPTTSGNELLHWLLKQ